jgi:hypothetical protein
MDVNNTRTEPASPDDRGDGGGRVLRFGSRRPARPPSARDGDQRDVATGGGPGTAA